VSDSFALHGHASLGRKPSESPALASANLFFRQRETSASSPYLAIPFSLLKQSAVPTEKQPLNTGPASSLKGSTVSSTSLELSLVSFLFNFAVLDQRPTSKCVCSENNQELVCSGLSFAPKDLMAVLAGISRQFLDFSFISLPCGGSYQIHSGVEVDEYAEPCTHEPRLPLHLAVVRRMATLVTRILAES